MAFLVNNLLHSAFFQLIVDQAQQCFIHYFEQFIVNLKIIIWYFIDLKFNPNTKVQGLIPFLGQCTV